MMKARLVVMATLAVSIGAHAAVDWKTGLEKCQDEHGADTDPKAYVACVNAHIKAQRDEEVKEAQKNQPKPEPRVTVVVRDTSTGIDFAKPNFGLQGASLSFLRKDGEDATNAKLALFGYYTPKDALPYQPFFGVSWTRDGTPSKRSDIRDVSVGAVGNLFEPIGENGKQFTLLATWQLIRRTDLFGTGDGNLFRAHFDSIYVPWAGGRSFSGFNVIPQVGYLLHDRTDGGAQEGTWHSAYAGININKPFEIGAQRFQASLLARRLYDLSVPGGNDERRDKYLKLTLNYYFYNPEDKSAVLQPSLFLQREVGNDFLSGISKTNKTTAGINFKLR